ncbi:MAG: 2-C-methyl-D-erythritol 4-phosphate cytidylyltransferase [Deltaproteobacteria bacterium]|nr:2-C-methyl-D-erythritol 4-phosphate cytidylyltransferase [Deltaproteobacteria bacterium]
MNVYALLLAGGLGERMGAGRPKQFLKIGGEEIISGTIRQFVNHPRITGVVVVIHQDWITPLLEVLAAFGFSKILGVTVGGETRQASSYAGVQFLDCRINDDDLALVHDVARPFVSQALIDRTIDETAIHGVTNVVVPATDTLIQGKDGFLTGLVDRREIFNVQTPQGFRFGILKEAHSQAADEGSKSATDDVQLAFRLGYSVKLVSGDYRNIKITTMADLAVAEAIARDFENA